MQHLLLIITIYLLLFLAIVFLIRLFVQKGAEAEAMRALGIERKSRVVKSPIIKLVRPLFRLFMPLARTLQTEKMMRIRRKQFIYADMSNEMTPEEFLAYQLFLVVLTGGLFLLFKGDRSFFWVVPITVLAFLFPIKWVKDRIRLRSEKIVRELPHAVDMLALSAEAGLGFVAGMHRMVLSREPTPLMREFEKIVGDINKGATTMDALRNVSNRCEAQELNQFVIVMIQSLRLGVPISKVLRAQSDTMRQRRFEKAERIGALATQKLIFPIVFCIIPATIIVILGPLAIEFLINSPGP